MHQRTSKNKLQNQHRSGNTSKIIGSLVFAMGLFLITAIPALAADNAEYDDVFINGYKLGFFEQLALENHMNRDIPDGKYWFELETGLYGPVGGPAIGRITVSEDYREFVESKFFNSPKATKVELSASAQNCKNDCLYW